MRRTFTALLVMFLASSLLASPPPAAGTATGKMTVNGKSHDLAYAYAWTVKNPLHEEQTATVVLLSDTKLSDKALTDEWERRGLAEGGKFTGVELTIDREGQVISGTIYQNGGKMKGPFSATGMHKWAKKTLTADTIEGRMSMDKEDDFFGTTYVYDATFKAPIAKGVRK